MMDIENWNEKVVLNLGSHSITLSIADVSAMIESVHTIAKTVKLQEGVNTLLEICVLKGYRILKTVPG